MTDILLAHAPDAGDRAALIAEKLAALGFAVAPAPLWTASPLARRAAAAAVDASARVVVLWSSAGRETPGLIRVAARAQAAGKLAAVARLDASAPPAGLRATPVDLSRWSGREDWRPWRSLVVRLREERARSPSSGPSTPRTTAPPAPVGGASSGAQRLNGLLAFVLMTCVVAAAYWAAFLR